MAPGSQQNDNQGGTFENIQQLASDAFNGNEADAESTDPKKRTSGKLRKSVINAFDESFLKKEGFFAKLNPLNVPQFLYLVGKNFLKELFAVKEEKKQVTTETSKALAKEVLETPKPELSKKYAKAIVKDAGMEEDKDAEEKSKDFFEAVFDALKDTVDPDKVFASADKINQAAEKNEKPKEPLAPEEVSELASISVYTLVNLKNRFSDEKQFADYLTKLYKIGEKSAKVKRLATYIGLNFKLLFKLGPTDILGILKMNPLKFAPLAWSGNMLDKGVEIVCAEIFPETLKSIDSDVVRDFIVLLVRQKKLPTPEQVAKLTFMLDTDDLIELSKRLSSSKTAGASLKKELVIETTKPANTDEEPAKEPVKDPAQAASTAIKKAA